MKQFTKYTLATMTGIVIMSVIGILLLIVVGTASIIAGNGDDVELKENSVLVVKLSGEIVEHKTANPFDEIMGTGGSLHQQGLDDIVGAIDKAASCDEIKGIYIEAGVLECDYASLQEIRKALERCKGKKFIVAFANEYSQGAYYVCSIADKVWINPEGMLDLHGIASRPMFLKDLLAKVGVKMKVVKVGTYKSATEQYTEDHMSEGNRMQVTRYVTSLWNTISSEISSARGLSSDIVNQLADEHTLFRGTEYLMQHRLVDSTMYANEVKDVVKGLLKIDKKKEINQVSCAALNKKATGSLLSSNKIAVYYCEGSIVRVPEAGAIMGDAGIVSKKVTKDLDDLAKDDDIKAVVIRVNSGGGDAFASEEIWHSVSELNKKKPVVVSMSGMAASGAYYFSAGASWIVAQPTTLTGSIGIFGAFPDLSGLLTEKLGISYDMVKTNKHADFSILQTARPFNSEEEAILQQYINRGYELFCKRVADGRKLSIAQVKQVAEGRVWIGSDALRNRLVDELGGMPQALKKAAALAKVKDYATVSYPTEDDWLNMFMDSAKGHNNNLDGQLRNTLGVYYEPFVMIRNLQSQSPIQARTELFPVRE